jgi:hypothetical protein
MNSADRSLLLNISNWSPAQAFKICHLKPEAVSETKEIHPKINDERIFSSLLASFDKIS